MELLRLEWETSINTSPASWQLISETGRQHGLTLTLFTIFKKNDKIWPAALHNGRSVRYKCIMKGIKIWSPHFSSGFGRKDWLLQWSRQKKASVGTKCLGSYLYLESSHNIVYILNSQSDLIFFMCYRHIATNSEQDFCL